ARTVVGYLRTGCFVLIELLSTNRFRNMPPIWKSWRCCRDLRSRARQRDRIGWNGCRVIQKAPVGSARGECQATKKDKDRSAQSPGHVPPGSSQSGQNGSLAGKWPPGCSPKATHSKELVRPLSTEKTLFPPLRSRQCCCLDTLRLSFQSFHRYGIALRNELIDARA